MGKTKCPRCDYCRRTWRSAMARKDSVIDHAMKRIYMKQKSKWVIVGWICPNCYMVKIEKPPKLCPKCNADNPLFEYRCRNCGEFLIKKMEKLVKQAKTALGR